MRLLRLRDLRIIVLAYGLSAFGDYLALIALTLRVYELTGSGLAVSGLLLTGLVPLVVFAPVAGLIVDRFETSRVLAITAVAQTVIALGLVSADTLPAILALSFLLSTGFAVTQPAVFAITPRVVGEEHTTEANAYLEVSRWGGAALGPLAAGGLTHAFGSDAALLVNAGTFFVVAAAVPFLRTRRPVPEAEGPDRARDGFLFLARDRRLLIVVVSMTAIVAFAAIDNVAEVFFAKDVLEAGDIGYGAMVTSWTLGMVVGATAIGRRLRREILGRSVLLAAVIGGAAIAVAAAFPSFPLTIVAFVIGGMTNGVELVGLRSLIHARVPDRLRGRVFSAYYASINTAQITAMVVGGPLVNLIGARGALLIGGGWTIVAALVGLGMLAVRSGAPSEPRYSTSVS